MSRCEFMEPAVSALADGELAAVEVAAAVDHLAACAGCRELYRRIRALDEAVAVWSGPAAGEPAPPQLWRRIAEDAAPPRRPAGARWSTWALRVAALALMACGVWWAAPPPGPSLLAGGDSVEVVLGSDPGSMTDRRFLEMTTELLRADRRYHRLMWKVMQAVAEDAEGDGGVEREDERPRRAGEEGHRDEPRERHEGNRTV